MADENRTATQTVTPEQEQALQALERALQDSPYKFGFFQAIRRLQALRSDLPGLGRSLRPGDDPVRLSHEPFLAFAPSALAAFHPARGEQPSRLDCSFMGLLGSNGPLPLHFTEFARERQLCHHDPIFVRFLDIFHHRLLSLFYRAWAEAQPTVHFDRPATDRFADYLGSLFGLGVPSLRDRDAWPDIAKRHHAGTLSCQTRHADGLWSLLTGHFQIPVAIEEFQPHWMELPDECRTQLAGTSGCRQLGRGAILGRRVWECQYKFRIVCGPLANASYRRFLPGGDALNELVAVVRNYVGDELEWDLQLVLKKEDRPALQLGRSGRLKQTAWLAKHHGPRDADDLVFDPHRSDCSPSTKTR